MSALHVFDMDGTLLRGTTAPIELSRRLNRLEPLADLEAGFAAERITAAEFALEMRELWTELSPELVAEVVSASPWIEGIAEVCSDIADRGERSMLITMSPDFFAEHLLEFGIDVVAASRFPSLPFAHALDPAGILQPSDKVRLAEEERIARGLMSSDCVANGDSDVDFISFGVLENTVAVNADESLERVAAVAYRGENLLEAYELARELRAPAVTDAMSETGPLVGASAVVVRDGLVIVGRRKGSHGAGSWAFPGEAGSSREHPRDVVTRELREETGLRALRGRAAGMDERPDRAARGRAALHHAPSPRGGCSRRAGRL